MMAIADEGAGGHPAALLTTGWLVLLVLGCGGFLLAGREER